MQTELRPVKYIIYMLYPLRVLRPKFQEKTFKMFSKSRPNDFCPKIISRNIIV